MNRIAISIFLYFGLAGAAGADHMVSGRITGSIANSRIATENYQISGRIGQPERCKAASSNYMLDGFAVAGILTDSEESRLAKSSSNENIDPPAAYSLWQNYPNPFNGNTRITFDLPEEEFVDLEIFDILGRHIKVLLSDRMQAGEHSVVWNGTDGAGNRVSGGIYFYTLKCNAFSSHRTMLYLK